MKNTIRGAGKCRPRCRFRNLLTAAIGRTATDAAEALLRRACALGSVGRYQSEGALQSARVYIRYRTGHANWADVAQLYDALFALAASPVTAINRALAIAELHGVSAALDALLCFQAALLPGPIG